MTEEQTFKIGAKVRDRAELGGVVLIPSPLMCKVIWNNGQTCWLANRYLRLDGEPSDLAKEFVKRYDATK